MGMTLPNKLFVRSIAAKYKEEHRKKMGEGEGCVDSKDVFSRIFLRLKLPACIVVQQDDSVGNTEQLVCMFSELLAMTLPAPYKYRHDKALAGCGTDSVSSRLNANDPSTISN